MDACRLTSRLMAGKTSSTLWVMRMLLLMAAWKSASMVGVLHCGGVDTEVYTLSGVPVYRGSGDVELAAGAYIVVANGRATKVVVN